MAALDVVLDRLVPLIENEVNLHLNIKDEAKLLAINLLKIKEVLDDAENKQLTSPSIKQWLDELRNLAYDVEDALDEWENKTKQLEESPEEEVEDDHEESPPAAADAASPDLKTKLWEKVSPFVHSLCSCFVQFLEHRQIALGVQDLNKRVEGMYDKAENILKLQRVVGGSSQPHSGVNIEGGRRLEDSAVDASKVQGRDSVKENLKNMLLTGSDESGVGTMKPIIAIVGVGGLGKTTLAKLIYNDPDVQKQFPQRIWVCVSEPFDEIRVAREILDALDRSSPGVSAKEILMKKIRENIGAKGKFLLVLDDVWTADPNVWRPLKDYLKHGYEGSKIMITTRNRDIAERIEATHVHDLATLTDDETWSIISQLALSRRSPPEKASLEGVGKEIAKKCQGLPLAAQFLGNLLHSKRKVGEWRSVLQSEMLKLENVGNDLFGPLFLSYKELEPSVKRCFSYCALFPKDTKLEVEELIRMWIAQGFIPTIARDGEMELEGQDYFLKLAHCGFFQDFERDENDKEQVKSCKMHDIVHDFAQYLTKGECSILQNSGTDDGDRKTYDACRHLLIEDSESALIPRINASRLRSLICCKASEQITMLISHLKSVRLLSLAGCYLENIPDEIGNLVGLRYLDLSRNDMEELPESICNLFRLQTLVLFLCNRLKTLPRRIFKLINLRHLILGSSNVEYPPGLQRLVNLRTLPIFSAKRAHNRLGYLKNLSQLGGCMTISLEGLDQEVDVVEASSVGLAEKESLQSLCLVYDENVSLDVLKALQPPSSLQHLECRGPFWPSWISGLVCLKRLELHGCRQREEISFPPLWNFGFLEELRICEMNGLKRLGREFLGLSSADHDAQESVAFPVLHTLTFYGCSDWVEWEDISEEESAAVGAGRFKIMPGLRVLNIGLCEKLKALPNCVLQNFASRSSLEYLQIGRTECLESFSLIVPTSGQQDIYCSGDILPSLISCFSYITKLSLIGGKEHSYGILPLRKLEFLVDLNFDSQYWLQFLVREFLGLSSNTSRAFIDADHEEFCADEQEVVVFLMLQRLPFTYCYDWEKWEDLSEKEAAAAAAGRFIIMPQLHRLEISYCRKLKELPHRLLQHVSSTLECLHIKKSPKLTELYQPGGADWDKIAHIPNINFSDADSDDDE